ncbi:hypothetical protein DESUT3_19650 [Desulfuromonas versatilis]|uniref:Uncharacterized protein n=1 Tax=Desulfuromonas versatilis TaxID=2802975 RepID=A0ABN6DY66_9BACT|nr:hypothetical protein DESUT3_19650 [Desulfuromonas versatilis]
MAQGFSWCFGSEGGPRLEYNPQGRCEKTDPCKEEGSEHGHADSHDSPGLEIAPGAECFDLPAFTQNVHPVSRFSDEAGFSTPATPPVHSPSGFSLFPLLEVVPGFRPQPPPPQQPTLAFLRTVVLRN